VPSIRTLLLPALLSVVAPACLSVAPALAGSKFGLTEIWDPTQHTTTSTDTIHIYHYRQLLQQTGSLDTAAVDYAGSGKLRNRCGPSDARLWCSTPVDYKLTTFHACSRGDVWSHLYVRALGQTTWRELTHYHDAVVADCP
jgi:hypothetical protein